MSKETKSKNSIQKIKVILSLKSAMVLISFIIFITSLNGSELWRTLVSTVGFAGFSFLAILVYHRLKAKKKRPNPRRNQRLGFSTRPKV